MNMPEKSVDAIEAVITRNHFYKHSYRLVTLALIVCVLIFAGLVATMIYMISHPPTPVYFATTNDGRTLDIVPVEQPNMSESEVLQWASTAAIASYTYSYSNWRRQLQGLAEYFTPEGWREFIDALTASNNLEAVKAKRLIVSAAPTGAAVLVKQGIFLDRYTWKVQIPLLVTYQNATQFTQQSLMLTMLVVRIPTLTSVRGVAVSQLIATEQ